LKGAEDNRPCIVLLVSLRRITPPWLIKHTRVSLRRGVDWSSSKRRKSSMHKEKIVGSSRCQRGESSSKSGGSCRERGRRRRQRGGGGGGGGRRKSWERFSHDQLSGSHKNLEVIPAHAEIKSGRIKTPVHVPEPFSQACRIRQFYCRKLSP